LLGVKPVHLFVSLLEAALGAGVEILLVSIQLARILLDRLSCGRRVWEKDDPQREREQEWAHVSSNV
jgi:hypothetical protein